MAETAEQYKARLEAYVAGKDLCRHMAAHDISHIEQVKKILSS